MSKPEVALLTPQYGSLFLPDRHFANVFRFPSVVLAIWKETTTARNSFMATALLRSRPRWSHLPKNKRELSALYDAFR